MEERAARLARYCAERVGDSLRLVAVYDLDGENGTASDVAYAREDLRERYTAANLGGLLDYAADVHGSVHAAGEDSEVLGEAEASVYLFENACVMQLVVEPTRGIVVSFEPEAAQYLSEFVTDCLEQVR